MVMMRGSVGLITLLLAVFLAAPALAVEGNSASPAAKRPLPLQRLENRVENRIENRQEKLEAAKEALEKRKAEIEAKREAFKTKLAAVRDQKKQTIVTRVDEKLSRINKNRVAHWQKVLTRLEEVLGKVEKMTTNLKTKGQDVTAVEEAITKAKGALAAAKEAVAAQGEKEYIITVTSETTLRINVGQAIKTEQTDLQAVLKTVNEARKQVGNAIKALAQARGEALPPVASPSGENVNF